MHHQSGIGLPVVRRDLCVRRQGGEHHIGAEAADVRHLHRRQRLGGLRAARQVLRYRGAATPQHIGAPAPGMVQRLPLVHRITGLVGDIGHKLIRLLRQHRHQFRANGVGLRLQLSDPGEISAVVEGDSRQAGHVQLIGLRQVRRCAARHDRRRLPPAAGD